MMSSAIIYQLTHVQGSGCYYFRRLNAAETFLDISMEQEGSVGLLKCNSTVGEFADGTNFL